MRHVVFTILALVAGARAGSSAFRSAAAWPASASSKTEPSLADVCSELTKDECKDAGTPCFFTPSGGCKPCSEHSGQKMSCELSMDQGCAYNDETEMCVGSVSGMELMNARTLQWGREDYYYYNRFYFFAFFDSSYGFFYDEDRFFYDGYFFYDSDFYDAYFFEDADKDFFDEFFQDFFSDDYYYYYYQDFYYDYYYYYYEDYYYDGGSIGYSYTGYAFDPTNPEWAVFEPALADDFRYDYILGGIVDAGEDFKIHKIAGLRPDYTKVNDGGSDMYDQGNKVFVMVEGAEDQPDNEAEDQPDNTCLGNEQDGWLQFTCAYASDYCTSSDWGAEARRCCPATCDPKPEDDSDKVGIEYTRFAEMSKVSTAGGGDVEYTAFQIGQGKLFVAAFYSDNFAIRGLSTEGRTGAAYMGDIEAGCVPTNAGEDDCATTEGYCAFYKLIHSVWGGWVPSVNHIWVTPDCTWTHEYEDDISDDGDVVMGEGVSEAFFLLFGGEYGEAFSRETIKDVVERFMEVADPGTGPLRRHLSADKSSAAMTGELCIDWPRVPGMFDSCEDADCNNENEAKYCRAQCGLCDKRDNPVSEDFEICNRHAADDVEVLGMAVDGEFTYATSGLNDNMMLAPAECFILTVTGQVPYGTLRETSAEAHASATGSLAVTSNAPGNDRSIVSVLSISLSISPEATLAITPEVLRLDGEVGTSVTGEFHVFNMLNEKVNMTFTLGPSEGRRLAARTAKREKAITRALAAETKKGKKRSLLAEKPGITDSPVVNARALSTLSMNDALIIVQPRGARKMKTEDRMKAAVDMIRRLNRIPCVDTVERIGKGKLGACKVKMMQGGGCSQSDLLDVIEKSLGDGYKAQVDSIVHAISVFPGDTNMNFLWGMHNDDDHDIDAPEAWAMHTGMSGAGTIIGVIDTGVDYTHPDLAANMWVNPGEIPDNGIDDDGNGYIDDIHGWNFVYDDRSGGDPMDDNGHGTHCAGTVGAEGDNDRGVVGVSWKAQIIALKFMDAAGSGWTSDAIGCLEYAMEMGATITSNSWGGGGYEAGMDEALSVATEAGHLFIAAAGNDAINNDNEPSYPCAYEQDTVLCVAASNQEDKMSYFSSYGARTVHVAAPGSDIYSTDMGGGYVSLSGTSMATPHVAGLAALLKSYIPLGSAEIKQIIMDSVDDLAAFQLVTITGGRINAASALSSVALTIVGTTVRPVGPRQIETVTMEALDTVTSERVMDTSFIVTSGNHSVSSTIELRLIGVPRVESLLLTSEFGEILLTSEVTFNVAIINNGAGAAVFSRAEITGSDVFTVAEDGFGTIEPYADGMLPIVALALDGNAMGRAESQIRIFYENNKGEPVGDFVTTVSVEVYEPPVVSVSSTELDLVTSMKLPAEGSITLGKDGYSGYDFTITCPTWLMASPRTGTFSNGAGFDGDEITFSLLIVATENLEDQIIITASVGDMWSQTIVIDVTLEVLVTLEAPESVTGILPLIYTPIHLHVIGETTIFSVDFEDATEDSKWSMIHAFPLDLGTKWSFTRRLQDDGEESDFAKWGPITNPAWSPGTILGSLGSDPTWLSYNVGQTSIEDGGDDMYDYGNIIQVMKDGQWSDELPYTAAGEMKPIDESGGLYTAFVTVSPSKLFIGAFISPDLTGLRISGNLGADGQGSVEGGMQTVGNYCMYYKQVYGQIEGYDPSINHIILTPGACTWDQTYDLTNQDDDHEVTGLPVREVYYLAFGGEGGHLYTITQMQSVASKFIDSLSASAVPNYVSMYVTGSHDTAVEFGATAVVTYGPSESRAKSVRIPLYGMQAPEGGIFVMQGEMDITVDGSDMMMMTDIQGMMSDVMPEYSDGSYNWKMTVVDMTGDFYSQTTQMTRMRRMQGLPDQPVPPTEEPVKLELTGDRGSARVEIPFAFSMFGVPVEVLYVAIDGYLSPKEPMMGAIEADLNVLDDDGIAAIAPFYSDLMADSTSSITTSSTATEFIVKWNDVWVLSMSRRVSFSVTLHADSGCVSFDHMENPLWGTGHSGYFAAGMVSGTGQVIHVDHSDDPDDEHQVWNMCPVISLGSMAQHSDTGAVDVQAYVHAEGLWKSGVSEVTATFRAELFDGAGRLMEVQDIPISVTNGACFDGARTPSRDATWCKKKQDKCDTSETIRLDCPETCNTCEKLSSTPAPTPPSEQECREVNDKPQYRVLCADLSKQCPEYCSTSPVFETPTPTPQPSCEDKDTKGACDVSDKQLEKKCKNTKYIAKCKFSCGNCEQSSSEVTPAPIDASTDTPALTPSLAECRDVNDTPEYRVLCEAIAEQCPDYCSTSPVFETPSPTPGPACEDKDTKGNCDISEKKLVKKCKNAKFNKKCQLACGSC